MFVSSGIVFCALPGRTGADEPGKREAVRRCDERADVFAFEDEAVE